ncbi:hypothetical protein F3Y22_tig00111427pilonHSYRG00291 [Hibiscus syriacus]|uniref:Uncharacterized protein n=1 Tax=Hibiscus syriacus TaxID=106335 RepID=A0A6A2XPC3_HIBSY|nr:hypothetical protein F3Y22_tig00111427pilonHSYRG00291 [Hibiscus syriacus]
MVKLVGFSLYGIGAIKYCFLRSRVLQIKGIWTSDGTSYSLVSVYASCDIEEQRLLWIQFESLKKVNDSKWFMGGDFYAVRNRSEMSGCGERRAETDAFNDFIENCSLFESSLSTLFTKKNTMVDFFAKEGLNRSVLSKAWW